MTVSAAMARNLISPDRVPEESDLLYALKDTVKALAEIYRLRDVGREAEALRQLSTYFKQRSAERYYFDWQNFHTRFDEYRDQYPDKQEDHYKLARLQMELYAPETQWILPFTNLRGEEVTAYALRHLARQQKSSDMALTYYYEEEDPVYLDYFVRQAADLNRAFAEGAYDDKGNGIYEVYRAGRRVQNWMFCHHAYLATPRYNSEMQLLMIRTLLHHGAQLYARSQKMRYGNHHTRGLVALFEIAVIFPEFTSSAIWMEHAIKGLVWHLTNEINADGFQFERSVHYHKGDIENYFRIYQLAKLSHVKLPEVYETQFKNLFNSLVKLAQPNRRLPVLQDDTDDPFAVNNSMDEVMILGTIVFNQPGFKYFAGDGIAAYVYWLLRSEQLQATHDLEPRAPEVLSTELPETGYYVMRNGWGPDAVYMTITAGLSEKKPDHQHGDMLGVVGFANGHEIFPNYQVKYNYADYKFFKNSWVKNVALADDQVLGRGWKQNEGKSGFGKWKYLPAPKVISWEKTDHFDHFIGTHNGFDALDIRYYREILFFHAGFWLVIDHFERSAGHTCQQIWQGDFEYMTDNVWQKRYSDGSGIRIIQIGDETFTTRRMNFRSMSNTIIEARPESDFVFTTLLIPFKDKEQIPGELPASKAIRVKGWDMGPAEKGAGWTAGLKGWGTIFIGRKAYRTGATDIIFQENTNFAVYGDRIRYLGIRPQLVSGAGGLKIAGRPSEPWTRAIEIRPGEVFLIAP